MKHITREELLSKLHTNAPSDQRRVLKIDGFHYAGVLVPVVSRADGLHLLFTKRTESVDAHKGQISFPGGMVDGTDPDIVYTALREAHEEVGLPPSTVEIVGLLDDLATPTGFVITPVVGFIEQLPPLMPNNEEVAEVFTLPMEFFADGSQSRMERREFQGESHEVWYYTHGTHLIWGATAAIVRSLLQHCTPT